MSSHAPPAARRGVPTLDADGGLLLLCVIWGINFSVVKAVLATLEPLALNALRFPLAAAALWLLLRTLPGPIRPKREDVGRIVALGILGNVVYQFCFILGIDATTAGNASLVLATTPVWTLILTAVAGHERPPLRAAAGILATVGGMLLVVLGRGDRLALDAHHLRGDLLMVGAALIWSVYTVGAHGPIRRYGALRVTAWTLWVGTPGLVVAGLPALARTPWAEVPFLVWAGVAYAGFLSIGVAYVLWYRGVQRLGNARTSAYSNLVPVAALATAWIWLGEVPAPLQLLGAAVILTGLTLARLAGSGQAPPGPSSPRWSTSGNS